MFLTASATQKDVNVYVSSQCTRVWEGSSYAEVAHVKMY